MSDDASFNPRHVHAIFGEYYGCLITEITAGVECHHILGRGGKYDRKMMSSILNCAPLWDVIHKRGWINNEFFQQFLLEIVARKVQAAVLRGAYEYNANDREFQKFTQQEFSPKLL